MAIILDGTNGLTYTGDTAASVNLAIPQSVGIGTGTPLAKLDVRGSSTYLINSTNPTAWISTDTTLTTQSMYMQVNTTSSDTRIGSYTNHALGLYTNNAARVTIDTSGNVGIGTASPAAKLHVAGSLAIQGSDTSIIRNAGNSWIMLSSNTGYNSNGVHLKLDSSTSAGAFNFFSIGTQILGMNGNGRTLTLQGGTDSAGAGIAFPATQSASSDVNTLDDYEEGTWTPNINSNNGTGTFTIKVGSYVKIGKQVTIWFVVDGGNSLAAGTTQYLAGLPFTIGSIQNNTILGQMGSNGPAIRTQQLMTLSGNRGVMYLYDGGSQETTTITFGAGCATYWID